MSRHRVGILAIIALAVLAALLVALLPGVAAAGAEAGRAPCSRSECGFDYDNPSIDAFTSLAEAGADGSVQASGLISDPFDQIALVRLSSDHVAPRGVDAATDIVRYDPDFAIGQIARGGNARASDLVDFGASQGWRQTQTATGPIKFIDDNGVTRLTIKSGSPRAPGSGSPHIEIRNAAGQRIDVYGNPVTRRSPGNHTSIIWDLGS